MKSAGTDAGPVSIAAARAGSADGEIEQRYLGLLEISGEAVLIVCESRIVFASTSAGELLGIEAGRSPTQRFPDFIGPADRDAVAGRIKALAVSGQTAPFARCRLIRPDGKTAEVEIALHACGYRGKPAVQVL